MIAQNAYNPNGPTDHNAHTLKPNEITNRPDKEDPLSSVNTKSERVYGNPQPLPSEEAITDLYMSDGDDYYIDDTAFSDAQMGTGENSTAASVVGSDGSESSETNSNVNTGVFGGLSKAAHPGYSLW